MKVEEETLRTVLHEHIIGLLDNDDFEVEVCENIIDDLKRKIEDKLENIPCEKCGGTDLPLHYNRLCPNCFQE